MTNEKTINLLKQEIDYLKIKEKQADEEQQFLYDSKFDDLRLFGYSELFTKDYEYKQAREKLEKSLNFYTALTEAGIDLETDYPFMDNVKLSIWNQNGRLKCYFFLEDDSWFYDNYISSHSGLNEWLNDLIDSEYELFSGNSGYCHAFGTAGLKDMFKYVEDTEYRYPTSKKVQVVKDLVEFTKENGAYADIRKAVVDMIEFRFNKMKELLQDD